MSKRASMRSIQSIAANIVAESTLRNTRAMRERLEIAAAYFAAHARALEAREELDSDPEFTDTDYWCGEYEKALGEMAVLIQVLPAKWVALLEVGI